MKLVQEVPRESREEELTVVKLGQNKGPAGRSRATSGQTNIVGEKAVQLVERRTGTPLTKVRFPDAAREFSPRVSFQCRLSYGVSTLLCAIACTNICVHVRIP